MVDRRHSLVRSKRLAPRNFPKIEVVRVEEAERKIEIKSPDERKQGREEKIEKMEVVAKSDQKIGPKYKVPMANLLDAAAGFFMHAPEFNKALGACEIALTQAFKEMDRKLQELHRSDGYALLAALDTNIKNLIRKIEHSRGFEDLVLTRDEHWGKIEPQFTHVAKSRELRQQAVQLVLNFQRWFHEAMGEIHKSIKDFTLVRDALNSIPARLVELSKDVLDRCLLSQIEILTCPFLVKDEKDRLIKLIDNIRKNCDVDPFKKRKREKGDEGTPGDRPNGPDVAKAS